MKIPPSGTYTNLLMIYEPLDDIQISSYIQVITQREAPEALFLLWNGTGVVVEKRGRVRIYMTTSPYL